MPRVSNFEKYGYNKTLLEDISEQAVKVIKILSDQDEPTDHIMKSFLQDFKECMRAVVTKVRIIEQYAAIRGKSIYINNSDDCSLYEASAAQKAKIARDYAETMLMTEFDPFPEEEELSINTD